jgi:hypothetical protein
MRHENGGTRDQQFTQLSDEEQRAISGGGPLGWLVGWAVGVYHSYQDAVDRAGGVDGWLEDHPEYASRNKLQ